MSPASIAGLRGTNAMSPQYMRANHIAASNAALSHASFSPSLGMARAHLLPRRVPENCTRKARGLHRLRCGAVIHQQELRVKPRRQHARGVGSVCRHLIGRGLNRSAQKRPDVEYDDLCLFPVERGIGEPSASASSSRGDVAQQVFHRGHPIRARRKSRVSSFSWRRYQAIGVHAGSSRDCDSVPAEVNTNAGPSAMVSREKTLPDRPA